MIPIPSNKALLTSDFRQACRFRPKSSLWHNAHQFANRMAQRTLWERLHGGFQEHCRDVLLQGAADWVEIRGRLFEEIVDVDAGGVDGML